MVRDVLINRSPFWAIPVKRASKPAVAPDRAHKNVHVSRVSGWGKGAAIASDKPARLFPRCDLSFNFLLNRAWSSLLHNPNRVNVPKDTRDISDALHDFLDVVFERFLAFLEADPVQAQVADQFQSRYGIAAEIE